MNDPISVSVSVAVLNRLVKGVVGLLLLVMIIFLATWFKLDGEKALMQVTVDKRVMGCSLIVDMYCICELICIKYVC